MDAIHEHARDSGLRLKGRRAIWNIDGVVGCLSILSLLAFNRLGSNSPPDGRNGPVLNWQVRGDEIAGRNEKRTGDPAVGTQQHTSARPRHGNN